MGLKSALKVFLKNKLGVYGPNYERTLESFLEISQHSQVGFLDAASSLYSVNLEPNETGRSLKLNDLVGRYVTFVQDILHDPKFDTFVVMFDRETPLAKYVNTRSDAEPTPLDTDDDHHEAWSNYFIRCLESKNIADLEYMLNSIAGPSDKAPTPFDYTLPGDGRWFRLMGNRAFKEYISWIICNAVFHFCKIPEGKTLVVLGPNSCSRQRVGNALIDYDPKFDFEMTEADFSISYVVKLFPGKDIIVFSIDGDVMLNLLYTHSAKVIPEQIEGVRQDKVYVVQKFNLFNRECTYIDIHQLWKNVRSYIGSIKGGRKVTNPVATFCTLCMLCGNDYVSSFPQIGPVNMFKGFEVSVAAGVTDYIYNPNSIANKKLNAKSYFQLVLNCYQVAFKNLHFKVMTKYEYYTTVIATELGKRKKTQGVQFSLETVRITLANLNWTVEYINYSAEGKSPRSSVTRSNSGQSLYGFDSDFIQTPFATYKVWRPEDTTLELLHKPF